ncbi:DEAD/DEAH box helicase [Burkholderia ambifaria]|nr:DEAD/DEAH box helicase [Burkholderia ambifaria]
MRPEFNSRRLYGITQAKARMYEYSVPEVDHIDIPAATHPEDLFALAIGIVGDAAGELCDEYIQRGTLLGEFASTDGPNLRFCASFFYAYVESKFDSDLDEELLTLAAATFYLAETPGSSVVISKYLAERPLPPDDALVTVLRHVLLSDWHDADEIQVGRFGRWIQRMVRSATELLTSEGRDEQILLRNCAELRAQVYRVGTAREIAFVDLCIAVILRKVANSSRLSLPRYSRLDEETWSEVLGKPGFVTELWPAQRLLGKEGLFWGTSAVIQMPTSAGKTRAVELLIRSSVLANRAHTAVIVAPFRALVSEISNSLRDAFSGERVSIDELSDVLQMDFLESLRELLGEVIQPRPQIIVLTPEKLLYVLRQEPRIAANIGLVVYDEGHQFDTGSRGVTYELLLTTLKQLLPWRAQIVLVSAVISNGEQVGKWLIGEHAKVVDGKDLMPTQRSVAFASWQQRGGSGRLEFVSVGDGEEAYFVPRVIESFEFPLRGRERTVKVFPKREDSSEVSLYLGLKLAGQGSTAIFCGQKASVAGMIRDAVGYFERGLPYLPPAAVADAVELSKLVYLHELHFGKDATATKGAQLGLLAHHGNTPQGLRLSIEHAVKEGLAPLVICTSTLAQGVNLPLRYLIVSALIQGDEPLTTRAFQNLMGRAGRAGMHIEGSVIFADTRVYDGRLMRRERWRWRNVNELLDSARVEPITSSLLSLIDPIWNDDNSQVVQKAFDAIVALVADEDNALAQLSDDVDYLESIDASPKEVAKQVRKKARLVNAVASFLQSSRGDMEFEQYLDVVRRLSASTLAYSLATDAEKETLTDSFIEIARAVERRVPDTGAQTRNSRTLLGLNALNKIDRWCRDHGDEVLATSNQSELLASIWPIFLAVAENDLFARCIGKNQLLDVAQLWLAGRPYHVIGQFIQQAGIAKRHGEGSRRFTPEDVVDICDNCFGYEFSLYLTALITYFEHNNEGEAVATIDLLKMLQSGLKYGLPDALSVAILESGFSDRMLAQALQPYLDGVFPSRAAVIAYIRNNEALIRPVLTRFPSYFDGVFAAQLGV